MDSKAESLEKIRSARPADGTSAALLERAAKSGDVEIRLAAAIRMADWGQAGDSMDASLLSLLSDPDPKVRKAASRSLRSAAAKSRAVVDGLIHATADAEPTVCWAAAESLSVVASGDPSAFEAVLAVFRRDPKGGLSEAATIGPAFGMMNVGEVVPWLSDEDPALRRVGADLLAAMALPGLRPSPALIHAAIVGLEDPDPIVRKGSMRLLGNLGESAAAAGPALWKCLEDPKRWDWCYVAEVLIEVVPGDSARVEQVSVERCGSANPEDRANAARVFHWIGTHARDDETRARCRKRLEGMLGDEDDGIREFVKRKLEELGPGTDAVQHDPRSGGGPPPPSPEPSSPAPRPRNG